MPMHKPPGWPTVIPRIFTEDPGGLCAFIADVFGAQDESQPGAPAELRIGESLVMVSSDDARPAAGAVLYVYVPDADAAYARAMAAGADCVEAPCDMFYGDRRATVRDRWGNTWQIATNQRE